MKKLLFLLLFATTAQAQRIADSGPLGFVPVDPSQGLQTFSMNAAANWFDCTFVQKGSKTINKVQIYMTSKTGTPASTDLTLALQGDSSGNADASSVETKTLNATPTASAWNEYSGFTTALTDGTRYHLVGKNINGTPASNFVVVQRLDTTNAGGMSAGATGISGNGQTWGWSFRQSTNSGTTWTTSNGGNFSCRIEYSDGSFAGAAIENVAVDGTNSAYSAREVGVKCTTHASDATRRIAGLSFFMSKNGTPGTLRYGLWTGSSSTPTNSGYTNTVAQAAVNTGFWNPLMFSSAKTIAGNTTFRVTVGVVSGGDASNYWRMYKYTIPNNAGAKSLSPWTNCVMTYTSDGTNFTDTDTAFFPFELIYDDQQTSGGTSLYYSRGMKGNLQ